MMVAEPAEEILREGVLCYLAVADEPSPHLTPVVFAYERGAVWATTARSSRKARLWRADPRASALVRAGGRAAAFRGEVTTYDALDPASWRRSILRGPLLARASARFTIRNLRFFAGYARDAHRVPFAWTPPGRVFLSVGVGEGAALDLTSKAVIARWGELGDRVASRRDFRRSAAAAMPDGGAPEEVRRAVGDSGEGVIAVAAGRGVTTLPAHWRRVAEDGCYYATLPAAVLALAGAGPEPPVSLVADRSSAWRAAGMRGLLLRGRGTVYVPGRVAAGAGSLLDVSGAGEADAVIRLRPDQAVWWKGWSSGTVRQS